MTIQNPFLALMLLTLLLCVNGQRNESVCKAAASKRSTEELGQVALDAIDLTIAEVNYAKDFFSSVPQLKSLQNSGGSASVELLRCVGGLVDCMNDVLRQLNKLEKLDSPFLNRDVKSLEVSVDGFLSFNVLCRRALVDHADRTINYMLQRKLQDVVLLTNDVRFRVYKFELDANAKLKP